MSRPLISADDVRAARRRRETRLVVPADAIVTPLARDEATRHGIDLVREPDAGSGSGAARSGTAAPEGRSAAPRSSTVESPTPSVGRHVPTCDAPTDPVERIVDRVLAKVPGADPDQVREIARRVLEKGAP